MSTALDSVADVKRLLEPRRLHERVIQELDFLRAVEEHGNALHDVDVVRLAVARYEHLWLPLCRQAPDESLDAPLDIAFMQHCHLLSPTKYVAFPFRNRNPRTFPDNMVQIEPDHLHAWDNAKCLH